MSAVSPHNEKCQDVHQPLYASSPTLARHVGNCNKCRLLMIDWLMGTAQVASAPLLLLPAGSGSRRDAAPSQHPRQQRQGRRASSPVCASAGCAGVLLQYCSGTGAGTCLGAGHHSGAAAAAALAAGLHAGELLIRFMCMARLDEGGQAEGVGVSSNHDG
jgi:hypothetical protein